MRELYLKVAKDGATPRAARPTRQAAPARVPPPQPILPQAPRPVAQPQAAPVAQPQAAPVAQPQAAPVAQPQAAPVAQPQAAAPSPRYMPSPRDVDAPATPRPAAGTKAQAPTPSVIVDPSAHQPAKPSGGGMEALAAVGAGLAVGKRVLNDGTGAEQDARMRDYLASTQHQMQNTLPGMNVYGSYEAFGAAKLAQLDAMEKRANPSYPYMTSANNAMQAQFGQALAQKLITEPVDLVHRYVKRKFVDEPKMLSVFHAVVNEDPMLRDEYAQNPQRLERSFAAMRKMSPAVAQLHGPVQSFLRHATLSGGTLDLAAVRQLAETQRFYQNAKGQGI